MTPSDFHPGDHVRYIPGHAHGDRHHPDCHPRRSTRVLPRVEPATLRAARDAAGHSQSQAAATLGIPIKRLQAWEHGEGAMDEGWLQLYLLLTGQTTVARARQALTVEAQ